MQQLSQYISEKLKIRNRKNDKIVPESKEELQKIINTRISEAVTKIRNGQLDFDEFILDLNDIDVSYIEDMSALFSRAHDNHSVKLDISTWDTGFVKNMSEMFFNYRAHVIGLENLDVSNVTNMSDMFTYFTESRIFNNGCFSNWNDSKCTNMQNMFKGCMYWDGKGIENWDVSNVTDMYCMFYDCNAFDGDLQNWDVSNVIYMQQMFYMCSKFDGMGLQNWKLPKLEKASYMFGECKALDVDLSDWELSNNPNNNNGNFKQMFYHCNTLKKKRKIPKWNKYIIN